MVTESVISNYFKLFSHIPRISIINWFLLVIHKKVHIQKHIFFTSIKSRISVSRVEIQSSNRITTSVRSKSESLNRVVFMN